MLNAAYECQRLGGFSGADGFRMWAVAFLNKGRILANAFHYSSSLDLEMLR